ncbi:MAG: bifunctional methylenetetrahydrofolate dehydrogenase/methenyltetrahydrofolate cyclohydrolase FolD [Gemmatimonadota bacterium]
MTARTMDGKRLARRIRAEVAAEGGRLREATGVTPGLAAVLVGDDPASATYVAMKERACEEAGFHSRVLHFPETTSNEELLDVVDVLNRDPTIHGILIQLPLPQRVDTRAVMEAVDPAKDVDGFHPLNVGRLTIGELEAAFVPATPAGILRLLEEEGIEMAGAEAVVVGRSDIVGKPVALLLLHRNATVTICHRATRDLGSETRRADILVVATGRVRTVTAEMVKPGAAVVDVGSHRVPNATGVGDQRLVGDVDEGVAEVAGHLTPVPGGVGPMTIAMLLENTLKSARQAAAVGT